MRITYTSPNRSHHYPYAESMDSLGALHAFVSGFSRFSPRSPLPSIGDKLKRHDFFQNIYLASYRLKVPYFLRTLSLKAANLSLDSASYRWAKESDAFIFYRTQGYNTTRKLKKYVSKPPVCIMEEVNSHVDYYHDILFEEYKRIKTRIPFQADPDASLRLKTYELADLILCPSEFVKRSFIAKGFDETKLLKVNFGFPDLQISSQKPLRESSDVFTVLYVGQIHYRKGLRYALEAFRKLEHPNKQFFIVGPKTAITGLENFEIPDKVFFKGVLKGDELANAYRNASIFILPSLEEGLALVQGEALSFGLPLIITTNTGGDDLINNGEQGYIVPIANSNSILEKMQLLADDHDLVNKMSLNAFNTARTLSGWNEATSKLINGIENFIINK